MEYRERLQQVINAFRNARVGNLLSYVFNHDEFVAGLEKELADLSLEIKNEPMTEPQFLQSLIQDIDDRDEQTQYQFEGYIQAVAEIQKEWLENASG